MNNKDIIFNFVVMNKLNAKFGGDVFMMFGLTIMAVLLFLVIPLSYRITLPGVYWVYQTVLFVLLTILVFLNTRWLAPKLLFNRRFTLYLVVLFTLCVIVIIILKEAETLLKISEAIRSINGGGTVSPKNEEKGHPVYFYIFMVEVLVLGINTSAIIIRKLKEEKEKRLEIEKDKIEMELNFLKSQINPHFFFNSLNTINALTYSDVAKSRVALKRLGVIMRYILYNTSNKTSIISEELSFIESYLDLMKMRTSKNIHITYSAHVSNKNTSIAPMLFLPFIENCFKHGISGQSEGYIEIKVTQNKRNIVFSAKNRLFNISTQSDDEQSHGIGIKNTKRRLKLLYPNRHTLEVIKNKNFEVLLKIELNDD